MTIFFIFIAMAFAVCIGLLFTCGRPPMKGDEDYSEEDHRTTWEDRV